jgi:hypothetical protein
LLWCSAFGDEIGKGVLRKRSITTTPGQKLIINGSPD